MNGIYAQLESELDRALAGLDCSQTQLRPTSHPEKWTIQQIVEHLLLTYRSTLGVLQQRIDKGTPTKAKPMLIQRLGQFTLISLGRFPHGRTAPAGVMPSSSSAPCTGDDLIVKMHAGLVPVDERSEEAQRLFGTSRCASHLVLGPLSIPQWRRFHLVHGRHHIKQIQAIRREHQV